MGLHGVVLDILKILVWGFPVEGLVRSHVIVEVLVVVQCPAGVGDGELAVVEVPEFDAGAVVGSLHATVELRAAGRQDVEGDVEVLAGLLEVRPELAAAIDLNGQQGVREVGSHGLAFSSSSTPVISTSATLDV